ncbi:hypothetical protein FSP39_023255 [Pinctada imbricata]|uniref:protein-tyrosine-phosphatase n=1 Tax=Pinctada imbricata TaxID=66713 RepID=A0AA89BQQ6_PINIB|nr:hypothetical protein FSP39_023255 [Pinctada imbricata]
MQVNHFHFTAWPDKDVPKSASTILDFRNKVVKNESSKDGPTLVHCSAGIGRTGTYIALDYLVREGEQEGSVDIVNCLTTLRRQRTQFVQTVEQYEFLHEALLEGLTMKDLSVDSKDFPAMYDKIKRKNPKSGKTFLREQFDDINTMIPNEKEGNFATAKLPENRKKNRYSNILAADNCRYFVTSSKRSDYINAIAIPSHNKTAAFALTQMPLPDTIEDFWNLVLSQSMTTIVMMNAVKKEKDPDIYWPLSGLSTFGKIKVQQLEEDVTNEAYRILKLSVTRVRSNECLVVKQFQCLFWPDEDGVPRGTRQMLQLMEDVDSWQRSNDNPTIVVHCLDGARKSGLFCAVSAILERVRAEQTVNVVRTISQMRSKRQQIVSSQFHPTSSQGVGYVMSLGFLDCGGYSADRLFTKRTNNQWFTPCFTSDTVTGNVSATESSVVKCVLFYQDNAPVHKSVTTIAAIYDNEHPPYSTDLVPPDFRLFVAPNFSHMMSSLQWMTF